MASLPPSSKSEQQHEQESQYERLTRKFREEPFVPLGILATCTALFGASVALRKGNQRNANRYFRWRIYAQGFTVLAMVAGSVYYGDARAETKALKNEAERVKSKEARDRWLAVRPPQTSLSFDSVSCAQTYMCSRERQEKEARD